MATEATRIEERALDALGNSVRRQIVALLAEQPRAVSELAAVLPVSRPAVSKHLRVLQGAALVTHRCEGTRNVYALAEAGAAGARRWLDSFWGQALPRFAMVAQSTAPSRKSDDDQR